jgi:2-polyprenyl-3-methyl-5-hydroxy-6-metoxy-1,4-benzoquinol methylase
MDKFFLDKLVHPVYKTPLQLADDIHLADGAHPETFTIKENVPILLTTGIAEELTKTDLHNSAGSSFDYKDHYQSDAATYDYFKEANNGIEREEINRLHQNILKEIPKNADWILDVGCGGGWLAKAMKGTNRHVISMDISDINPIKAIASIAYPTHYGLVADVFDLPVKENSIDCIIASEIIEHVSDPKLFLETLIKALKPGGKLIVTTPYNEQIRYSLCIHCNKLTPHNAHLHSFTEASIQRFLPQGTTSFKTKVFNNKVLVRLGLQRLFGFLPLGIWTMADNLTNALTKKRAYRLMLTIQK